MEDCSQVPSDVIHDCVELNEVVYESWYGHLETDRITDMIYNLSLLSLSLVPVLRLP